MAVTAPDRWTLFREVIGRRKSGALVLQLGPKYITWAIAAGNLAWISSTHPDHTLTQFLLQNSIADESWIRCAQLRISETRSLGAALLRSGHADPATLREWTALHAAAHSHYLLQTTAHIFWSDNLPASKPDFVTHDGVPLSQVLLSCERNAVEIRSAVQFSEEMPERYRIDQPESLAEVLLPGERRLLPYLSRGDSLAEMLADPELDRLTCYRALFLLWLSGRLKSAPVAPPPARAVAAPNTPWSRARSVPPDWIFPLALGIALGLIFSPDTPAPPEPQPRVERLDRILRQPAWKDATRLESDEEE